MGVYITKDHDVVFTSEQKKCRRCGEKLIGAEVDDGLCSECYGPVDDDD